MLDATSKCYSQDVNPSRKYRFLRPVDCSRGASTPERRSKKQSAGRHEAFRRSNSAFLTLVGKGDAKSRHSEILIVAAVTGFEIQRRIDDYTAGNRFSVKGSSDRTLFPDGGEFICMVFLAEDEVPGEVRHQTDVAGHPKFQSRADLTERSDVMVVNRISGQVFALTRTDTETLTSPDRRPRNSFSLPDRFLQCRRQSICSRNILRRSRRPRCRLGRIIRSCSPGQC